MPDTPEQVGWMPIETAPKDRMFIGGYRKESAMTDGPIVSEEDREAAATLCEHIENDKGEPVSSWAIDLIRAGKADHHCTVQAFARHRLAHSLPSQADAGEIVEALRLADALLRGANMDRIFVERKVSEALAKVGGA